MCSGTATGLVRSGKLTCRAYGRDEAVCRRRRSVHQVARVATDPRCRPFLAQTPCAFGKRSTRWTEGPERALRPSSGKRSDGMLADAGEQPGSVNRPRDDEWRKAHTPLRSEGTAARSPHPFERPSAPRVVHPAVADRPCAGCRHGRPPAIWCREMLERLRRHYRRWRTPGAEPMPIAREAVVGWRPMSRGAGFHRASPRSISSWCTGTARVRIPRDRPAPAPMCPRMARR